MVYGVESGIVGVKCWFIDYSKIVWVESKMVVCYSD